MLNNKNQQLIEEASLELGISKYAIEKDYYVTQAIAIATSIRNELFELVFQGGTCLAKAHRIIKRMSEDCVLYKNHNDNYFHDPISEIKRSITELSTSKTWEDYWNQFLETMVYDDLKPSYQEVIINLNQKTDDALKSLSNLDTL